MRLRNAGGEGFGETTVRPFEETDRGLCETMDLGGIPIANRPGDAVVEELRRALARGGLTRIAFLNAHCFNVAWSDRSYRESLREFLVLPDGVGVDWGARILYGRPFAENLNGTDFVPRLLGAIDLPMRVALVGGAPSIAGQAAEKLRAMVPHHAYQAVSDGYFGEAGRESMLERLEEGRFDIVLVAMGVPAQEIFIADWLNETHGRLAVGVGALFDFLAGNAVRAPAIVRRLRMEWFWRLALEPGRLWRRYVLGNPLFLARMVGLRLRSQSGAIR